VTTLRRDFGDFGGETLGSMVLTSPASLSAGCVSVTEATIGARAGFEGAGNGTASAATCAGILARLLKDNPGASPTSGRRAVMENRDLGTSPVTTADVFDERGGLS